MAEGDIGNEEVEEAEFTRWASAAFARYRDFTMIAEEEFRANLRLAMMFSAVPGAVVECGTWKGGMIAAIAQLLKGDRRYVLCDSFQGLPPAQPIDGELARRWQEDTGSPGYHDNCTASRADAELAMRMSKADRVEIVPGWFEDTLPGLQFDDEGIAVLRLDADWHAPTLTVLENLFPQVNPGGLVLIDDYHTWDGCSRAVHEYLTAHARPERINTFDNTVAFIEKRDRSR